MVNLSLNGIHIESYLIGLMVEFSLNGIHIESYLRV